MMQKNILGREDSKKPFVRLILFKDIPVPRDSSFAYDERLMGIAFVQPYSTGPGPCCREETLLTCFPSFSVQMQSHRCPTVVFPRLLQHGGRLLLAKPSMAARVQSFSRGYVSRIQGFGVFAASASNAIAPASASKSVLLVESPTKARKIQEYLGSDYAVRKQH